MIILGVKFWSADELGECKNKRETTAEQLEDLRLGLAEIAEIITSEGGDSDGENLSGAGEVGQA